MKRIIITFWISLSALNFQAQDTIFEKAVNAASRMLEEENRLTIGGYSQIDYNQPLGSGSIKNGTLDIHRMVLLFGYKFNQKAKFISEIEFEHVKEVSVEQAFLQYEISSWLNFRGGLVLIPMGIINEFHEPPTFNGVERPNVDKIIIPSTWREIGAGFSGTFPIQGVSYQVYVVNGLLGFDGEPKINGSSGFRSGRQKGAESVLSFPNLAIKMEHFGISGLQVGLSGFFGKTGSTLYKELDKSDGYAMSSADSSVIGISMMGADLRFRRGGLQFRGQVNFGFLGNSEAYNLFTGSDAGSSIYGCYGEVAYNILHLFTKPESELIPFIRFEQFDTQASVTGDMVKDEDNFRQEITIGLGWKITPGAIIKGDYQFLFRGSENRSGQLNFGIGVWF